jgi:hypothetical protein
VNFDFNSKTKVVNETDKPQHLYADYTFGRIGPIDIGPTRTVAYTSRAVIDVGIVAAGASSTIDSTISFTLPTSYATQNNLEYNITIRTEDSTRTEGYTDKLIAPFSNRYRGYIYTIESSPEPLATLDPPLDWRLSEGTGFRLEGAYPNPSAGSTTLSFMAMEAFDSVHVTLHRTPHQRVMIHTMTDGYQAGHWTINLDLPDVPSGLYRLDFTGYIHGKATDLNENIAVTNF